MSETQIPNPEAQFQAPDPEGSLVASALSRISSWRRDRKISSLESDIALHEFAIERSELSQEVNQTTGQYTIETGPDSLIKLPDAVKPIDEAHKGILRPMTTGERRVRRKAERAYKANTRKAGVVFDLDTTYGRKDPAYQPSQLPDRKPGIGNQDRRAKVDEALRRAGLLTDQAPERPQELFKLGTPEHRAVVDDERLRPREFRWINKAERKALRFGADIADNVALVESIANGTDRSSRRHERRQRRLAGKIARKQQKLAELRDTSA